MRRTLRNRYIALGTMLLFVASLARATTLDSTNVIVNVGEPDQVTFYFGPLVGGTQVIIQCHYNRGFYITDSNVYGKQQESAFLLPDGCALNINDPNYAYAVNQAPFTFHADAQNQDVTIDFAHWSSVRQGCGRGSNCYKNSKGSAQIEVQ